MFASARPPPLDRANQPPILAPTAPRTAERPNASTPTVTTKPSVSRLPAATNHSGPPSADEAATDTHAVQRSGAPPCQVAGEQAAEQHRGERQLRSGFEVAQRRERDRCQ